MRGDLASSNPFASSSPITTSLLKSDSFLPSNTHITGTLSTVLGKSPEGEQPALRFNFRGSITHDSDSINDYTIPQEGGSILCRFSVNLDPGSAPAQLVDEAQAKFGSIMRLKAQEREIALEGGGLLVKSVSAANAGCEVKLEGTGRRGVKLHDGSILDLFGEGPSQEVSFSDTPPWFASPPSETPAKPKPTVESNGRMRRITELAVPSFDFLYESANSGRAASGASTRPAPSDDNGEEQNAKRRKTEDELHEPQPSATQSTVPAPSGSDSTATPRQSGVENSTDGGRDSSPHIGQDPGWEPTPFDRPHSERTLLAMEESPFTSRTVHLSGSSPDARPSPALDRRQVEDNVRARRRIEAEDKRRQEAQAQRLIKAAEEEERANELETMCRSWICTDRSSTTYYPLNHLQSGMQSSMMGVVVEVNAPKKAKDWLVTIIVADPTTHTNGSASDDTAVTIFRRDEADLPSKVYPGCPILFRNLSFNKFRDKTKGNGYTPVGKDTNSWAWMGKNGEIKTSGIPVTPSEKRRLEVYKRWWTSINGETGVAGGDGRRESVGGGEDSAKKGSITLAETIPATFFEATVKIVHVQHNTSRQPKYELYVTDGTVHDMPTRNFHGIDNQTPPNAIFCLAIFGDQPKDVEDLFVEGNVLRMKNVLCKLHSRSGELELKWAEKVLSEQRAAGWKNRSCSLVAKTDDRVRVINTRINALRRGEMPPPSKVEAKEPAPVASALAPMAPPPVVPVKEGEVPMATHLSTTFTDPADYPVNTLGEIIANRTVPNKYRVQARVKSIHPRNPGPNPIYVQYQCTHCKRQFITPYCQSCNDQALAKAELRYRLIAVLEQGSTTLPILIADDDAAAFLPPLPPLSHSSNPNDRRKTDSRIKQISNDVVSVFLGARMDGERTRPIIDWSLESFEVEIAGKGKGKKGKGADRVLVFRAFGMKGV